MTRLFSSGSIGHVRRGAAALALALISAMLVPAFQAPASAASGDVDASIQMVTPPPTGPLLVGKPFTFTVRHVLDTGGVLVFPQDSTITYVVPDEFRIDSAQAPSNPDYRCGVAGQTITCDWSAFSSVSSLVTLVLTPRTVGAGIVSTLSIVASGSEPSPDPNPNQISFTRDVVASTVDLGVWSYASADPKVGVPVSLSTFVYVAGAGTASEGMGATFVQEIPAGMTIGDVGIVRQEFNEWQEPLAPSGSCTTAAQTVTCTDMDLTSTGQYVNIEATPTVAGSFSTMASVVVDGIGQSELTPNPTPNDVSLTLDVTSGDLPSAVSGQVTDATAAAVVGAEVAAFGAGDSATPTATATTGAGGSYAFPALPVGTYRLRFTPPSGSPLPIQWSGPATSRALANETAVLGSGTPVSGVDAVLVDTDVTHVDLGASVFTYPSQAVPIDQPAALYYVISNVSRMVDGAPVASAANVRAVAQVPPGFTIASANVVDPNRPEMPVSGTCAIVTQTVTCTGIDVEAGGYRWVAVEATPTVGGSDLVAGLTVSSDTQAEVVLDPNSNNASLSLRVQTGADPSQVSGTVLGSDSAPIEGVAVWAYLPTDGFVPPSSAWTETDANGYFSFPDLAPGTYALRFGPPASAPYVPQWSGGSSTREGATPVVVDGSGAPIDASERFEEEAGAITGTVRGPGGVLAAGVAVHAFLPGVRFFPAASAVTGVDGTYTLSGLRQGATYEVAFRPSGPSNLAAEWYDNSMTRSGATSSVLVGAVLGGIDADLATAGSVSGTVTGPTGTPLAGVRVVFFGPSDTWAGSFETVTAANGTYVLTGASPSSYQVRFVPPSGSGLSAQWFDGTPLRSASTPVVVTMGGSTPGVDASWSP